MTLRQASDRRFAVRRGVPYAVLLVGTVLSAAAAWYVFSTASVRFETAFRTDADKTRHEIEVRLNSHFDVVRATAALLTANNEMSGAEFRAYVNALDLGRRYPGLDGIGFARLVRPRDLEGFLGLAALDGTPVTIRPAGPRPEYCPVMFLEPEGPSNAAVVGLDLTTDPVARAALARARDEGHPVVSGRVDPAGPLGATPGTTVLFLAPVFRRGAALASIDERRRGLIGLVMSPVHLETMFRAVEAAHPTATFELYDGTASDAALRFSTAASPDPAGYRSTEAIAVAGQPWLVTVGLGRAPGAAVQAGGATLGGGLVLALLLFTITRGQTRAWETSARHRADLQHLALHDALTGLPNRALLEDRLGKAIATAERHARRLAVLFLDVDRFKQVNDVWGHAVGDELLRSIAGRLVACVRRLDTVSRHGGDEFVLLLTDIDEAQHAADRAQELISAARIPHSWGGHAIEVTASVGVSIYPDDGREPAALLQAADAAMYQAKERGRNTCQFFTAEMNARALVRHRTEAGLRRALEQEELVLHYQPTIALATGELTGVEALVRWRDPERGLVGPIDFIPVAEESGLIVAVGRWTLREACRQARAWCEAGTPTTVAVNVSAVELRASDFLDHACDVLRSTGLDPWHLELELTESVLMQQAPATVVVLEALRELGVTIAIDDFGTGYSSVTYLRQFPVDVLKVDRSFVHEITRTHDASPIVGAMISMGRSLGHRVVAEGVETAEQYAFLRAHQCSEGQGYYFSRALPAEEIAGALTTPSGLFFQG